MSVSGSHTSVGPKFKQNYEFMFDSFLEVSLNSPNCLVTYAHNGRSFRWEGWRPTEAPRRGRWLAQLLLAS